MREKLGNCGSLFKVGGWKGGRRVRERADSFGGKKRKVLHPSQADLNQKRREKKKKKITRLHSPLGRDIFFFFFS